MCQYKPLSLQHWSGQELAFGFHPLWNHPIAGKDNQMTRRSDFQPAICCCWLSLWSQAICWELSLLSPDHVCKNNPRRVTNSSAGHQKENNHDINNHLKTQPGRICRQQQPTFNLTQEPYRALQLSKKVPIKARVWYRLALSVGNCRTSPIYFFSIFTWAL